MKANDTNLLKKASLNIPTIECFIILPAEDEEPEDGEENDNESSDINIELNLVSNS